MPVYPFPGRSASSCTSPGCLCRDRRPAYPSDTTDEQWRVLRPEAETVMAGLVLAAGRPMVHDLRAMLDAVFYVARNGVEWRALPADFPPHAAVYKFFERWSQRELPETLVHRLRRRLRVHQGRDGEPTAVIVDSQIVKAADTVGKDSRGFHGGKKINGIAFLWFIGVIRDRIGAHEDRFFATVFLGSGLLFVGMLFVAAAVAGGLVAGMSSSGPPGTGTLTLGRNVTAILLNVYSMRMAAVFTLTTVTIARRTQIVSRWLTVAGLATALVLLVGIGISPWAELLFPAWILALSIDILAAGPRATSGSTEMASQS